MVSVSPASGSVKVPAGSVAEGQILGRRLIGDGAGNGRCKLVTVPVTTVKTRSGWSTRPWSARRSEPSNSNLLPPVQRGDAVELGLRESQRHDVERIFGYAADGCYWWRRRSPPARCPSPSTLSLNAVGPTAGAGP